MGYDKYELEKRLYATYCKSLPESVSTEVKYPEWDELPNEIKAAWVAVEKVANDYFWENR